MRFRTPRGLALPVAAVSLLLLGVGISGAWYAHRLQRRSARILDVHVSGIRAGEELELHVRELRRELERYLLSRDGTRLKNAISMRKGIDHWLGEAIRVAGDPEEFQLTARIRQGLETLFGELHRIEQRAVEDDERHLNQLVQEVLTGRVIPDARAYLDVNEEQLEQGSAENKRMSDRLVLGLLLLGSCGAIAGLVAGYGVARGVGRAMVQLSVPIRDVAGKLNEVVGPVSISADLGFDDLEKVLQQVSGEVDTVVRRLHESYREMVRADQLAALGQLAAGLAHELRNPLMCIKVLVQSARRRQAPGALLDGEDLAVLETEIRRLEDLLQTFLDFARPAQLDKKPVDLRALAERTVAFLLGKANRRNVAMRYQNPVRPVVVDGDESQLRQVLLNLLLNALDAVHSGGAITVTLAREQRRDAAKQTVEGGWAVLRVSDNGPGLPQQGRERLFEPFFSTKETGIGLGLAICKRIVESHGGEIEASNAPPGGATFTVRLPVLCTTPRVPAQTAVRALS